MRNFSDINEGVLDKTSNKIKNVKNLTKEWAKKLKDIEKIGSEIRFLPNEVWSSADDVLKRYPDRDFIGNEIRFGDFVMFSTWGDIDSGPIDFGFVISDLTDDGYKIANDNIYIDFENVEDPFCDSSWICVKPRNIIVMSRLNDVKSMSKGLKNLFKKK